MVLVPCGTRYRSLCFNEIIKTELIADLQTAYPQVDTLEAKEIWVSLKNYTIPPTGIDRRMSH